VGVVEPIPIAPLKKALSVVVEPPLIVRPPCCVPLPMVLDAKAVRPPLNWVRVEVALPVTLNGYEDASDAPVK